MSKHDRGAFGELLAEAKALGCDELLFAADLRADPDDAERWEVWASFGECAVTSDASLVGAGRTGEEALRRFVEALRVARVKERG